MIVGQSSPQHMAMIAKAGRSPLDDIFCRAAARRPDAIALADPPNRAAIAGGAPRRLTFAEADRMISAVAGRLRGVRLRGPRGVGLQMGHTHAALGARLVALAARAA